MEGQTFRLTLQVVDKELNSESDSHFEVVVDVKLCDTIETVKQKIRRTYIILDYQQEEVTYKGFVLTDSQQLSDVVDQNSLSLSEDLSENFAVCITNKPEPSLVEEVSNQAQSEDHSLEDVSIDYRFEVSNDSHKETIVLSEQDCIMVENDVQSYVLVSKSGTVQLNHILSALKDTKIEKVRVKYVDHGNDDGLEWCEPEEVEEEVRIEPPNEVNHNDGINNGNQNQIGGDHENDVPVRQVLMNIVHQLGDTVQVVIGLVFKGFLVLQVLGIRIPEHFVTNWWKYLIYAILAHAIYSIAIAPHGGIQGLDLQHNNNQFIAVPRQFLNSIRTGIEGIRDELIRIGVRRTRDYQYVLEGKNVFIDNIENGLKDILMYFLSAIPSVQDKLELEIDSWKNTEVEELEIKVRLYAELIEILLEKYNTSFVPEFDMGDDISFSRFEQVLKEANSQIEQDADEMGKIQKKEEKFKLLIEYYKLLQKVYPILNKSMVSHIPYKDGKRKHETEQVVSGNEAAEVVLEGDEESKVNDKEEVHEKDEVEIIEGFEGQGSSSASTGVQMLHEEDN